MRAPCFAVIVGAGLMIYPLEVFATEDPCSANRDAFNGYWWGGQMQVHQHVADIPLVLITRFSFREIRHRPCFFGAPVLAPGVGEAYISIGVPIFNRRRGGWMLRLSAQGQGSQRPGEPIRGMITGAPAMAGHLNLWETPLPLVQLTGAVSAAIAPSAQDSPMSIAYLGGFRVYPIYKKHVQTNLGLTIGGSNAFVNLIPVFGFRAGDFAILKHRIAIGAEFRMPVSLIPGPIPYQWRFWSVLTLTIDEEDGASNESSSRMKSPRPSPDLMRSSSEVAPQTQTSWETPL